MNLWGTTFDLFWIMLWGFILVSFLFLYVFVLIDVFRDHALAGGYKALWVITLVFVPLISALIYVIARGKGMALRWQNAPQQPPEDDDYRVQASASPAEDIARAQELLAAGAITQGEFDAIKSKALGHGYFG
jgi:uncharacterized membrane protein